MEFLESFLGSLAGKGLLALIFLGLLFLLFNGLTPFMDSKERNPAYWTMRGGMLAAQVLAMAPLVTRPWNPWNTLDFLLWDIGGNLYIIKLLLVTRFAILEPVVLYKIDNLTMMRNGNMSVAWVESSVMVGVGLILAALFGGTAPNRVDGALSVVAFSLGSLAILVLAYLLAALPKTHRYNGQQMSLNDGIRANDQIAAPQAVAAILVIALVLRGAVAGDFEGWWPSVISALVTALISFALAFFMGRLAQRWLLHHSRNAIEARQLAVYAWVAAAVQIGAAYQASNIVGGVISTI